MKYLLTPLVSIGLLLAANSVAAIEVAGIQVEDKLTLSNHSQVLNGAGVRSKFFMDLYVGSLYLPQTANNFQQVLNLSDATIRLNITSGLITAEKMRTATLAGFDAATAGKTAPISEQIATFMSLFESDIIEGDQFTFATQQNAGVAAYKNGDLQATIDGEAFRKALLGIWLGQEPAQGSLKEAMLGL